MCCSCWACAWPQPARNQCLAALCSEEALPLPQATPVACSGGLQRGSAEGVRSDAGGQRENEGQRLPLTWVNRHCSSGCGRYTGSTAKPAQDTLGCTPWQLVPVLATACRRRALHPCQGHDPALHARARGCIAADCISQENNKTKTDLLLSRWTYMLRGAAAGGWLAPQERNWDAQRRPPSRRPPCEVEPALNRR